MYREIQQALIPGLTKLHLFYYNSLNVNAYCVYILQTSIEITPKSLREKSELIHICKTDSVQLRVNETSNTQSRDLSLLNR